MNSVSELIAVTLNIIDGVERLATFNKLGQLAAAADTPGAGFGPGRVKEYDLNATGLASVKTDWGVNSATYKAFAQACKQVKRPAKCQIMKRSAAVAQVQAVAFSGPIQATETIEGIVNGVLVSVPYDTDSATTLADLDTAVSAIEGVSGAVVASNTLTVTSSADWNVTISLTCTGATNPTTVAVTQSAGRTAADDVADALLDPALNDWYVLVPTEDSKAINMALAHYAQALQTRKFILRTNESNVKSSGNTTNIGSRLEALEYDRVDVIWHHDMTEYINVCFGALLLGSEAGKIQGAHRTLTGVTPTPASSLSASEVAVVQGRRVNTYRKHGSKGLIEPGVSMNGRPLEMVRDLDYLSNAIVEAIYAWLTNQDKVDYDDAGRTRLRGVIKSAADISGVKQGIARGDLPLTIEVLEFADMNPADVTAGYFVVEVSLYYKRGTQKVLLTLNSISGGAV